MYLAPKKRRRLDFTIYYCERRIEIELPLSGISVCWSFLQLEPKILVPQKEILKTYGLVRAKSVFEAFREAWAEHERSISSGQIVRSPNLLELRKEQLAANKTAPIFTNRNDTVPFDIAPSLRHAPVALRKKVVGDFPCPLANLKCGELAWLSATTISSSFTVRSTR
jgi:hypothetical protein